MYIICDYFLTAYVFDPFLVIYIDGIYKKKKKKTCGFLFTSF